MTDKPTTEQMVTALVSLTHVCSLCPHQWVCDDRASLFNKKCRVDDTIDAIRRRLTDHDALKARNKELEERNERQFLNLVLVNQEIDRLKAEVERLKGTLAEWDAWASMTKKTIAEREVEIEQNKMLIADLTRDMNEYHDQAEKAEAELAEARPLLEATMQANSLDADEGYVWWSDKDQGTLLRAAIAYRAAKEKQ